MSSVSKYQNDTFFHYFDKGDIELRLYKYTEAVLTLFDRYYFDKRQCFKCFIDRIMSYLSYLINSLCSDLKTCDTYHKIINIQCNSSFSNINVNINIDPNIIISKQRPYGYELIDDCLEMMENLYKSFNALPRIPLGKIYNIVKIKEALSCRRRVGTSSKKVLHSLLDNNKLSYICCPFVDILMNDKVEDVSRVLNLLFKKKQNLGEDMQFCLIPYVTLSKVSEGEYKLTFDTNFVDIYNLLVCMHYGFLSDDKKRELKEETTYIMNSKKSVSVELVMKLRETINSIKYILRFI